MRPYQDVGLAHDSSYELALAVLSKGDFACAQATPGFSHWESYNEFRTERSALYLAYAAAGIRVQPQRVSFAAFMAWARLTGAPIEIRGLDEFAAHWRWRVRHPDSAIFGTLGVSCNPALNTVAHGGAQCVRVHLEVFLRWQNEWPTSKLFGRPDIDSYAARVVEYCFPSPGCDWQFGWAPNKSLT